MDEDQSPVSAHPVEYPKGGHYCDLLRWHLTENGTHPKIRKGERGKDLDLENLARELHPPEKREIGFPFRNLKNWIKPGGAPPKPYYSARQIQRKLFFDEDMQLWNIDLEDWAIELWQARKARYKNKVEAAEYKSPGEKTGNVHVVREISLGVDIAALAAKEDTKAVIERLVSSGSRPESPFLSDATAAAAIENTEAIIDGLTDRFLAGREPDVERVNQFVDRRMVVNSSGLMVVTAPAGFGKSALAAHWCKHAGVRPNRKIIRHFCSASYGETSTDPARVVASLRMQIERAYGVSITESDHVNVLRTLLKTPPPGATELIVWLDGVDEASGTVLWFLPQKLGDRVCIIVSARAEEKITPSYLEDWLGGAMANPHNPDRHLLGKLSRSAVSQLIGKTFAAKQLAPPSGLDEHIYYASEEGYPLFVSHMVQDAVDAVSKGEIIDFGERPGSLLGYARSEVGRLQRLEKWPAFRPLFAFLLIARDAVRIDEFPELIGESVHPESLPSQFSRWLNAIEYPEYALPTLLGFTHSKLAQIFGKARPDFCASALESLRKRFQLGHYDDWPTYALQYLPQHFLHAGCPDLVADLLMDISFVAVRMQILGPEKVPSLMAADWSAWYAHNRHGAQYD